MRLVGKNEVEIELKNSTGPMGPAGPQGPQGETGPAGPQGEQGPAGVAYIRVGIYDKTTAVGENMIVTINEEIA